MDFHSDKNSLSIIDYDVVHHSNNNINGINEPLPQSLVRPSKYRCNKCLQVYESPTSYYLHYKSHIYEEPYHFQVCGCKFCHVAYF